MTPEERSIYETGMIRGIAIGVLLTVGVFAFVVMTVIR